MKKLKKTDYDFLAKEYVSSQEEFYKDKKDISRERLFSRIEKPIKGKKILEIGAGAGDDLECLYKAGGEVYGIDISTEMIKLANEKHPHLKNLYVGSFEENKFADDFFDLIVSRFTIHYSNDLDKGFKEAYRVLKSKGVMIFLVPHPLVDFIVKKNKVYEKSEVIRRPVFSEKLFLNYPTHTLSEYLSKFVLDHFDLVSLDEEVNISDKNRETGFLVIKLRKK